ncbi:hypothetical protein J8J40_31535, partial [Mycobacterium tuberculosis]|nr:hypothetical protein [Mycobacterium tuberculosis]
MDAWLTAEKIPLGSWMKRLVDALQAAAGPGIDAASETVRAGIEGLAGALLAVPATVVILIAAGLAYW